MKTDIFVALSTFAQYGNEPLDLLKESGFLFYVNPSSRRVKSEEIIDFGREAKGIIAGVEIYDSFVLDHLPNLKCISRCGVGIDNIDALKTKEKGITILNTPDVVIQPVAELTVAMIFDILKKLTSHTILMRAKQWQKIAGNLLAGKKVGILGLGRIGKRVAEILKKLDVIVCGTDLFPDKTWADQVGVRIVSTQELLRSSDILSIHLSEKGKELFCLRQEEINQMKQGAVVINVSRGKYVDENALYEALKSRRLSYAGLDVYEKEPYTGKLAELDNVILTPHVATLTEESRLKMEIEATQNLINFLKNT